MNRPNLKSYFLVIGLLVTSGFISSCSTKEKKQTSSDEKVPLSKFLPGPKDLTSFIYFRKAIRLFANENEQCRPMRYDKEKGDFFAVDGLESFNDRDDLYSYTRTRWANKVPVPDSRIAPHLYFGTISPDIIDLMLDTAEARLKTLEHLAKTTYRNSRFSGDITEAWYQNPNITCIVDTLQRSKVAFIHLTSVSHYRPKTAMGLELVRQLNRYIGLMERIHAMYAFLVHRSVKFNTEHQGQEFSSHAIKWSFLRKLYPVVNQRYAGVILSRQSFPFKRLSGPFLTKIDMVELTGHYMKYLSGYGMGSNNYERDVYEGREHFNRDREFETFVQGELSSEIQALIKAHGVDGAILQRAKFKRFNHPLYRKNLIELQLSKEQLFAYEYQNLSRPFTINEYTKLLKLNAVRQNMINYWSINRLGGAKPTNSTTIHDNKTYLDKYENDPLIKQNPIRHCATGNITFEKDKNNGSLRDFPYYRDLENADDHANVANQAFNDIYRILKKTPLGGNYDDMTKSLQAMARSQSYNGGEIPCQGSDCGTEETRDGESLLTVGVGSIPNHEYTLSFTDYYYKVQELIKLSNDNFDQNRRQAANRITLLRSQFISDLDKFPRHVRFILNRRFGIYRKIPYKEISSAADYGEGSEFKNQLNLIMGKDKKFSHIHSEEDQYLLSGMKLKLSSSSGNFDGGRRRDLHHIKRLLVEDLLWFRMDGLYTSLIASMIFPSDQTNSMLSDKTHNDVVRDLWISLRGFMWQVSYFQSYIRYVKTVVDFVVNFYFQDLHNYKRYKKLKMLTRTINRNQVIKSQLITKHLTPTDKDTPIPTEIPKDLVIAPNSPEELTQMIYQSLFSPKYRHLGVSLQISMSNPNNIERYKTAKMVKNYFTAIKFRYYKKMDKHLRDNIDINISELVNKKNEARIAFEKANLHLTALSAQAEMGSMVDRSDMTETQIAYYDNVNKQLELARPEAELKSNANIQAEKAYEKGVYQYYEKLRMRPSSQYLEYIKTKYSQRFLLEALNEVTFETMQMLDSSVDFSTVENTTRALADRPIFWMKSEDFLSNLNIAPITPYQESDRNDVPLSSLFLVSKYIPTTDPLRVRDHNIFGNFLNSEQKKYQKKLRAGFDSTLQRYQEEIATDQAINNQANMISQLYFNLPRLDMQRDSAKYHLSPHMRKMTPTSHFDEFMSENALKEKVKAGWVENNPDYKFFGYQHMMFHIFEMIGYGSGPGRNSKEASDLFNGHLVEDYAQRVEEAADGSDTDRQKLANEIIQEKREPFFENYKDVLSNFLSKPYIQKALADKYINKAKMEQPMLGIKYTKYKTETYRKYHPPPHRNSMRPGTWTTETRQVPVTKTLLEWIADKKVNGEIPPYLLMKEVHDDFERAIRRAIPGKQIGGKTKLNNDDTNHPFVYVKNGKDRLKTFCESDPIVARWEDISGGKPKNRQWNQQTDSIERFGELFNNVPHLREMYKATLFLEQDNAESRSLNAKIEQWDKDLYQQFNKWDYFFDTYIETALIIISIVVMVCLILAFGFTAFAFLKVIPAFFSTNLVVVALMTSATLVRLNHHVWQVPAQLEVRQNYLSLESIFAHEVNLGTSLVRNENSEALESAIDENQGNQRLYIAFTALEFVMLGWLAKYLRSVYVVKGSIKFSAVHAYMNDKLAKSVMVGLASTTLYNSANASPVSGDYLDTLTGKKVASSPTVGEININNPKYYPTRQAFIFDLWAQVKKSQFENDPELVTRSQVLETCFNNQENETQSDIISCADAELK